MPFIGTARQGKNDDDEDDEDDEGEEEDTKNQRSTFGARGTAWGGQASLYKDGLQLVWTAPLKEAREFQRSARATT